jgi:hypothetical protein
MTDWKWRLMLFVPVTMNTADNRTSFAEVFVNNGSGETLADERKMFDNAMRLSITGTLPVLAYGISVLVKSDMRDDMNAFIDDLNDGLTGANRAQWYTVANTDFAQRRDGTLIASTRNTVDGMIGQRFTIQDALNDLGVQRIDESLL